MAAIIVQQRKKGSQRNSISAFYFWLIVSSGVFAMPLTGVLIPYVENFSRLREFITDFAYFISAFGRGPRPRFSDSEALMAGTMFIIWVVTAGIALLVCFWFLRSKDIKQGQKF